VSVIYVLLPVALILAGVAVYAFIRAARSGQFDDLETPAHRILHDDEEETHHPKGGEDREDIQHP
jgi:cbb3-type cytochrome oxidase maturation protein